LAFEFLSSLFATGHASVWLMSFRRVAPRLLAVVAALVLGDIAISFFAAWQLTGPVRKPVGEVPPQLPAATETVSFPARDGLKLSGWFLSDDKATTAAVLLHGHGSTRRQMIARARLLQEAGYAVLLYDARGQGLSEGDAVSAGWYETADLLGALDFLRARGFQHFGCLGASQGGATILL